MISCPVDALIASTLLMAAVLLLRAPVRRLFGPTVAYALWALPALRLLLPPLPESLRESGSTPITQASEAVYLVVGAPEITALPGVQGPDYAALAVALWAAVAGAFLLFHLVQYALFRVRLLRRHQPVRRVGAVRIVLSPAAPGPLAFGVWDRYVALPADLDQRYDADEQALALAHELGHHARGDLVANWAALALLAIHWWNPVAWVAHRAFRADQELANDARVLRERGREAAYAYACAILKTAHGGRVASVCHLHTVDRLKGRLRMLKHRPASPRRLFAGGVAVAALAAGGLALTASGTAATAAVRAEVGETLGVDLDTAVELDLGDVMPAPPTPPVPPAPASPALAAIPATPAQVAPVPPAPPAPEAAPVPPLPPAPPVPPVPSVTASGRHQVWISKDGDGRTVRRHLFLGPDARPFDPSRMPRISSRDCGGGERPVVRDETRDGRRIVVICTDRMKRMTDRASREADRASREAARAAALAAVEARTAERWVRGAQGGALDPADGRRIERDALRRALEGLRGAREAIEGNPQLTPDQKRDALRGIEQGEREIREGIARGD